MAGQLYQYKPLQKDDEIRIFHLKADNGDGSLQCTIEHVRLQDAPQFTAVSYVWGSNEKPHEMTTGDNTTVRLTQSLYTLLKDLRGCKDISAMPFWVDQICINQADAAERNRQVRKMYDIYKSAAEVITYIGPKGPRDDAGLDLGLKIFNAFGGSCERSYYIEEEDATALFAKLPANQDPSWASLRSILSREWPERLWIVQENVVNKQMRIACGSRLIPWELLPVCYTTFSKFGAGGWIGDDDLLSAPMQSFMRRGSKVIGLAMFNAAFHNEKVSLFLSLIRARGRQCAEPKDRIYALLGIASDVEELGIQVDYGLSDVEVFRDAAERILRNSDGSLELLYYTTVRIPGLPSWAPSWHPDLQLGSASAVDDSIYNASAGRPGVIDFEENGHVLLIEGILLDEITFDAGVLWTREQGTLSPSGAREAFRMFTSRLSKLFEERGSKPSKWLMTTLLLSHSKVLMMFAETLIEGTWRQGGKLIETFQLNFLIWFAMNQVQTRTDAGETALAKAFLTKIMSKSLDEDTIVLISKLFHESMLSAREKHICLTKGRRLCNSRFPTKPGDRIFAPLGGRKCFILRPSGPEHYEFVSDSYYWGFMNGEAFEGDEAEVMQMVQKIKIR